MKTIMFYISSMGKGGAQRVLSYLAEDVGRHFQVTVLTDHVQEPEYALPETVRRMNIGDYPGKGLFAPIARKLWRTKKIREAYREIMPDIAVGFMGKNAVRLLVAARKEKGMKIAAIRMNPVHEFGNGLYKRVVCRLFMRAAWVVCQNESQRQYFPKRLQKKTVVIKNPIGEAFCQPRYEGARPQKIVAVGRLDDNKNHQMLIRAFQKVHARFPKAELTIYGEGEARSRLEALTGELGLEKCVMLPGIVEQIPEKIYDAAAYVLCSVSEGISNALLEAMALGLAVVSTDCEGGSAAELIRDGENGFLVPVNDVDALSDRLVLLLEDPERNRRLGESAAEVGKQCGRPQIAMEWEKLLRKTIAFHISILAGGGAERVISNLANEYAAQGYEVFMLTDSGQDQDAYRLDERVRRVVLPKSEDKGRIANAIGRIQKLRSAVKETRASVLVSFIGKSNIRSVLATRFLKTGVVVSVRSAPAREYPTRQMRMLAKVLFRMADGVVFQTEEAQQFFSKGIRRKSAVLMNPLHPDFMRERYTGERKQEIVTVGRLHSVKNHEMLIAAFAAVSGDYPALTLRIYGDGDREEKLRSYIDELSMQGRVVLEGNQSGVAERIGASRIFVLSSNVEGMPNALLEAMALGLACISTDCPCGGPRTVIRDGENGLLVPVGDTAALEAAIRRILSDPGLEERLGMHAAEIKQELAPERVNKMWMDYIAHCMKA